MSLIILKLYLFWPVNFLLIFYEFILKLYLNSVTVSRDEIESLA